MKSNVGNRVKDMLENVMAFKMPKKDEYLFVYGTLRSEITTPMYRYLVRHADLFDYGYFQGKLYEVNGYPGVVPSANADDQVLGEVYLLKNPGKVLNILDNYEGCTPQFPKPHEYRREQVKIRLTGNNNILAWTYLYNMPVNDLYRIESGDYTRYFDSVKLYASNR